jgi:hypothetical protein
VFPVRYWPVWTKMCEWNNKNIGVTETPFVFVFRCAEDVMNVLFIFNMFAVF